MLIRRCTWHRIYRGYPIIMGFRRGHGLRPYFTDGMCWRCARRAEREWLDEPVPRSRAMMLMTMPIRPRGVALAAGLAAVLVLAPLGDRTTLVAPPAPPSRDARAALHQPVRVRRVS